MRERERILQSLENVYGGAFTAAEQAGETAEMARLDMEYQRDQLHLEVLLDIRELLTPERPPDEPAEEKAASLMEKARKIRRLTKLRP